MVRSKSNVDISHLYTTNHSTSNHESDTTDSIDTQRDHS